MATRDWMGRGIFVGEGNKQTKNVAKKERTQNDSILTCVGERNKQRTNKHRMKQRKKEHSHNDHTPLALWLRETNKQTNNVAKKEGTQNNHTLALPRLGERGCCVGGRNEQTNKQRMKQRKKERTKPE